MRLGTAISMRLRTIISMMDLVQLESFPPHRTTVHGATTTDATSSPPPLAGEGQGGGTPWDRAFPATPSPPLPLERGREQSEFAGSRSPLHQRTVVEPAVEPVLISRHVLLHRDVDEGLIERDARHVGEGEIDEAFDVLVVGRLVALRRRGHGAVDQRVELLRLIAHGVEDRILAVIAPDEEVFGIVEPTREHVGVERQHLLVELGAPGRAGNLVDRALDAYLGEALLGEHAERLVDA